MPSRTQHPNDAQYNDMQLARRYFQGYFDSPANLPVAYSYGGREYRGMPADSRVSKKFIDSNIVQVDFTARIGSDNEIEVRAECFSYRDYPVVEWTVFFSNAAVRNTDILSGVKSFDAEIKGENAVLVYNNGDFCSGDGYTVSRLPLSDGVVFSQSPDGGRPCDGAFPYQRILFDGFGINLSIGWSGQWLCRYEGIKNGIHSQAGQESINTYLKPGESFRTPRMTLMIFEGGEIRGMNIWRRWFNAHVTPKSKGSIVKPRLYMAENAGGIEFTKADEQNQLDAVKFATESKLNINLWWLDAGWYPCRYGGEPDWTLTGSWFPDPDRFPNGLAPLGRACEEAGIDLLVWFEPERVSKLVESQLIKEHREWLLHSSEDKNNCLLDLSNRECFDWLCETVSSLIKESGIKCYRQDFNFAPLSFWRQNESHDRLGMLENQYIAAYLAYWDYLLLNIPDLWIDSCASGGRRNDMETMRRAVALHPTDFGYGNHHINQAFRHTLHSWFPYTRSWTQSWDRNPDISFDNYKFVNGLGSLSWLGGKADLETLNGDLSYAYKMIGIWERFTEIQLNGNFYPLTENHRDTSKWTVFQFDRPEKGEGAFQVLRNSRAENESLTVCPSGFCESCQYAFENPETGECYIKSGEDINVNGLTFSQPMRSGAVWFYKKTENINE